jgi:NADH:ubiquinone oxidoreductase subunit K
MSPRRGERGAVAVRPLLLRLLGLVVLLAAWVGLVIVAIDAARSARDGDDLAWLWVALAGLGAVIVLAAALAVGRALVRGEKEPRGGKHR